MFYKNIISSVLILLVIFSSPGSSLAERAVVGYEYTNLIASNSTVVQSMATDSSNNHYIFGRFSGNNVDFNPSISTDNHSSNGGEDIFLTKINADGSYGYTKIIGGPSEDSPFYITSDSSGALYFVGGFEGTNVDFGFFGNPDLHSSLGIRDGFLTKINADGSYGYTKTVGGIGAYITLDAVSVDSSGMVYMAGYFSETGVTVDFDPSGGTDFHTLVGETDGFLTKINADGSYGYTKIIGSVGDYINLFSIDNDSFGNIYLAGQFNGVGVDLDPSIVVDPYTSTDYDGFLTKINADGSYEYTQVIEGSFGDEIRSVQIDSLNNIYLAGLSPSNDVDLDPTAGEYIYNTSGADAFLIKLNSDSEFEYAKVFGGSSDDGLTNMTLDSNDNIYLTGYFLGNNVDLDPSVGGTDNHSSNGDADMYLIKIKADGSYGYAQTIGGTGFDYSLTVTVDSIDNAYFGAQFFSASVDFDPTIGTDTRVTPGTGYGSVTKLSQTLYHHITSLPGTLTAQVSSTEDSVDDTGVDDGILKDAEENIRILHSTVPLADMDTTFSADLDWSTITGESDAVNYKSFVHNLTTVDGADSAFTLYVPYRTGDTAVTVCPGASVLTDVAYTCTGAVSYTDGVSGVSIVTIGASQFWSIPNQTGTGGISGAPVVASSGSSSGSRPRSKNTGFISDSTSATNPNSNTSNTIQKYIFTKTLRVGSTGEEVKELQKYLNTHGFPVALSGPGSLGNETNFFGRLTKSALMLFQKSKGLVPDGIMGPITRGVINAN